MKIAQVEEEMGVNFSILVELELPWWVMLRTAMEAAAVETPSRTHRDELLTWRERRRIGLTSVNPASIGCFVYTL